MNPSVTSRRLVLHTAHVLSKKRAPTTSDIQQHLLAVAQYLKDMTGQQVQIDVSVPLEPDASASAQASPKGGGPTPVAAAVATIPVN